MRLVSDNRVYAAVPGTCPVQNPRLSWWRPSSWLSPKICQQRLDRMIPFIAMTVALLMAVGLLGALWWSPPDYQQGESVRIIYIHVPCAFWSMGLYMGMAFFSLLYWVFHLKIADPLARACVAPGILMTALALLTGSLWGKPMWGTFWIWDARLTSELLLLFLFLGVALIRISLPSKQLAAKAAALLAVVGSIDVPIIHFSVQWWNSLHQGSTLTKFAKPSIDTQMLIPLLIMIVAVGLYCLLVVSMRASAYLKQEQRYKAWLSHLGATHGSV